jgi:hypothetical protein
MEDSMRQPLQILVDAIPDAALRPLLLELLQNGATSAALSASADGHKLPEAAETTMPASTTLAPAKRGGRGWPRGKPRKTTAVGESEAERTARLARHAAAQRVRDTEKRRHKRAAAQLGLSTGGNGVSSRTEPAETALAAKLWARAAEVQPTAPWKAIVEEFGTNAAVAMNACRSRTMPPNVVAAAVTRFLEVPPAS